MSQIYHLTFNVIVTSFQMGLIPNFNIILARYSEKCVQSFFFFLSYRVATFQTQMQGGNYIPPPSGQRVARSPSGRRVDSLHDFKGRC